MAVGASRADIRSQFFVETLVLCLLGGAAGALLGLAVTLIASTVMLLDIKLSVLPFVLTIGAASLVGVLAGTIPAIRASNIQPGVAIKQE
jgi:ABC-type antimicrobial peptide transport system permease subunit